MAMLVWVMMGLAIWHFTIFVPDHFWGGIVGAFIGACIGAAVFGLAIHGVGLPARDDVDLLTAFEAIPGAVLGMGAIYAYGLRRERQDAAWAS